jgi:hypothetical protein
VVRKRLVDQIGLEVRYMLHRRMTDAMRDQVRSGVLLAFREKLVDVMNPATAVRDKIARLQAREKALETHLQDLKSISLGPLDM